MLIDNTRFNVLMQINIKIINTLMQVEDMVPDGMMQDNNMTVYAILEFDGMALMSKCTTIETMMQVDAMMMKNLCK